MGDARKFLLPALSAATLGLALAATAFLPVSNLVITTGTIMGERLFYLPLAGVLLATFTAGSLSAQQPPAPAAAPPAPTPGPTLAQALEDLLGRVRPRPAEASG